MHTASSSPSSSDNSVNHAGKPQKTSERIKQRVEDTVDKVKAKVKGEDTKDEHNYAHQAGATSAVPASADPRVDATGRNKGDALTSGNTASKTRPYGDQHCVDSTCTKEHPHAANLPQTGLHGNQQKRTGDAYTGNVHGNDRTGNAYTGGDVYNKDKHHTSNITKAVDPSSQLSSGNAFDKDRTGNAYTGNAYNAGNDVYNKDKHHTSNVAKAVDPSSQLSSGNAFNKDRTGDVFNKDRTGDVFNKDRTGDAYTGNAYNTGSDVYNKDKHHTSNVAKAVDPSSQLSSGNAFDKDRTGDAYTGNAFDSNSPYASKNPQSATQRGQNVETGYDRENPLSSNVPRVGATEQRTAADASYGNTALNDSFNASNPNYARK
ncbi:hypothetical protein GGI25_001947 [Coemansia spiralis]|uniref:Uncharacterized protein n=2 Tax=Coemansia TaxID=4863 RepID=A0A9W8G9Q8_9FUNG|nr:hypothetical protein EDC05_002242 [Coemansia umbellata]KAJ2623472.1 hypothetical protein GGI26_002311 [Coemansia sp. RSA 1358]KAJ2678958.1 hypothetical protein GGI25_001947 [Coemansia spiralis]